MVPHYLEKEWEKREGGKSIKRPLHFCRCWWGLKKYQRSGNVGLISAQVIGSVRGEPTLAHMGCNAQRGSAECIGTLCGSSRPMPQPCYYRVIDRQLYFNSRPQVLPTLQQWWLKLFASQSLADRASDKMAQQCRQIGSEEEDGYWFQ